MDQKTEKIGTILDGTFLREKITVTLTEEVARLYEATGKIPSLTVVMVGDDPSAGVYIRQIEKLSKRVGIEFRLNSYSRSVEDHLLIDRLNDLSINPLVSAILIQLPLPKGFDSPRIIQAMSPAKDVDCVHPANIGRLFLGGEDGVSPCTPAAAITLLEEYHIPIAGRRACVIGRSNIVGKPVAIMLLKRDATVTVCHSKTIDLPEVSKEADILMVAIGKAQFVDARFVKEGAVVIDIGTNYIEGKVLGDVNFDEVSPRASYITPVPGGVAPLTNAMLMRNVVTLFKRQNGLD